MLYLKLQNRRLVVISFRTLEYSLKLFLRMNFVNFYRIRSYFLFLLCFEILSLNLCLYSVTFLLQQFHLNLTHLLRLRNLLWLRSFFVICTIITTFIDIVWIFICSVIRYLLSLAECYLPSY